MPVRGCHHEKLKFTNSSPVKYTSEGSITVRCRAFEEPPGLRTVDNIAVELVVADTGCGITSDKLESIFREFEQVENSQTPPPSLPVPPQNNGLGTFLHLSAAHCSQGLIGLGLAVVARIVDQLGGQLRVDSKPNEGSRFSLLIPFVTSSQSGSSSSARSRTNSHRGDQIDSLVQALQSSHLTGMTTGGSTPMRDMGSDKVDGPTPLSRPKLLSSRDNSGSKKSGRSRVRSNNPHESGQAPPLRILIVEVSPKQKPDPCHILNIR